MKGKQGIVNIIYCHFCIYGFQKVRGETLIPLNEWQWDNHGVYEWKGFFVLIIQEWIGSQASWLGETSKLTVWKDAFVIQSGKSALLYLGLHSSAG